MSDDINQETEILQKTHSYPIIDGIFLSKSTIADLE